MPRSVSRARAASPSRRGVPPNKGKARGRPRTAQTPSEHQDALEAHTAQTAQTSVQTAHPSAQTAHPSAQTTQMGGSASGGGGGGTVALPNGLTLGAVRGSYLGKDSQGNDYFEMDHIVDTRRRPRVCYFSLHLFYAFCFLLLCTALYIIYASLFQRHT